MIGRRREGSLIREEIRIMAKEDLLLKKILIKMQHIMEKEHFCQI